MKKNILFLSTLLTFSISVQAQHFGVKLGGNYSNIAEKGFVGGTVGTPIYKYWGDATGIVGLNAGAFFQFDVNKKLQIQPEVIFSMKGFSTNSYKFSFNYLSFPVLVGYSVTPNFTIQVGPEVSYLINLNEGASTVLLTRNTLHLIDVSALAGATVNLSKKIGLNIRYNYSLMNLYDVFLSSETKTWHRTIQASIQYRIK